jgi:hypothetical protein
MRSDEMGEDAGCAESGVGGTGLIAEGISFSPTVSALAGLAVGGRVLGSWLSAACEVGGTGVTATWLSGGAGAVPVGVPRPGEEDGRSESGVAAVCEFGPAVTPSIAGAWLLVGSGIGLCRAGAELGALVLGAASPAVVLVDVLVRLPSDDGMEVARGS